MVKPHDSPAVRPPLLFCRSTQKVVKFTCNIVDTGLTREVQDYLVRYFDDDRIPSAVIRRLVRIDQTVRFVKYRNPCGRLRSAQVVASVLEQWEREGRPEFLPISSRSHELKFDNSATMPRLRKYGKLRG